jgi:transglutaminase-like putative cysteine protease
MPIKYLSSSGLDKYIKIIGNQLNTYSYLKQIFNKYRGNTIDFLMRVTEILHTDFEKTVRHDGSPHKPDLTLKHKRGSCRDLAVLEMEMLRKSGFATRFVSGYKFNEGNHEDPELHAWVEVFIPGPGWIGLDPSTGLMVGNDHIPVASSFLPVNTLPVSGTFRGKAGSDMKTKILIEKTE